MGADSSMDLHGWQQASLSTQESRNQEVNLKVDEPVVRLKVLHLKMLGRTQLTAYTQGLCISTLQLLADQIASE
jgi:hypothetical protein